MGRNYSAYSGTRIGREMDTAINRINVYARLTVAEMTKYPLDINQTVAMLFPDEIIAKAAAAKGIVAPSGYQRQYTMGLNSGGSALLSLDYTDAHMLPVNPDQLQVNAARVVPLMQHILEVEAIYLKFEEVKAVLRWLNKNATLGAIRHYFPTALKLCPDTFLGMDIPSRHETPEDIELWLQPMRNASATIASALMLPSSSVSPRDSMWLTFPERKVTVAHTTVVHPDADRLGKTKYTTDPIVFNI